MNTMRLADDQLVYLGAAALLPGMLRETGKANDWEEIEEEWYKALSIATMMLGWQRSAPKMVAEELERLAGRLASAGKRN